VLARAADGDGARGGRVLLAFGTEHFIHIGIPKRATGAVLIEGAAT
jgi:hypothetical protein